MPDDIHPAPAPLPLANPLHVALFEPEIPGNAGNVARLCAATGSPLHLIGRLGFSFAHPKARRAVMDYWNEVDLRRHVAWEDFAEAVAGRRVWMLTTRAERSIWEADFAPGDVLLLGPESRGLPAPLLESAPERCLRIPMVPAARSLNLGSSASVALYEAIRQAARQGR
jgi:tRNA (cytidine/uridine-2'-O-)-methyltransferase